MSPHYSLWYPPCAHCSQLAHQFQVGWLPLSVCTQSNHWIRHQSSRFCRTYRQYAWLALHWHHRGDPSRDAMISHICLCKTWPAGHPWYPRLFIYFCFTQSARDYKGKDKNNIKIQMGNVRYVTVSSTLFIAWCCSCHIKTYILGSLTDEQGPVLGAFCFSLGAMRMPGISKEEILVF
jgi:hypothetical protein